MSDAFGPEYRRALSDYLVGAGEAALQRAHQLGRKAMAAGLGVLDVAAIHHESLQEVWRRMGSDRDAGGVMKQAGDFLRESLSAFEITHRGYQEANVLLRHALEFAAVVCHELRTPLTSIQASTGLLQEILTPDPAGNVGRLLANVLHGASALNARMNDLVDMAGFQSGSLSIHLERVAPGQLLRRLCEQLEPEARRAGVELGLNLLDDPAWIQADPRRLEQVISNLVHNALKFAADGGRIDIHAREMEGHLVIEVQDYGKGIPAQDQGRIFQPYVRVHPQRQRVPGFGIGLALCRQLVHAHHGRIWVVSEAGKGSAFKFTLPLDGAARLGGTS